MARTKNRSTIDRLEAVLVRSQLSGIRDQLDPRRRARTCRA